jgi:hypothetical protein
MALSTLADGDQRGSRARCLLLTRGSREDVAARLTAILQPFGFLDPVRHDCVPRGPTSPAEARLGETPGFLPAASREAVLDWWLAVRGRANTPNWDIAATASIAGREGLMLVEAKAYKGELSMGGHGARNPDNVKRISGAIGAAGEALNAILPGWSLTADSHYQLANRFAWAWKIASLGVPVALVYLGFLGAREMGRPLADAAEWERALKKHASGIVPDAAWERELSICGTPLIPMIRSLAIPLQSRADL